MTTTSNCMHHLVYDVVRKAYADNRQRSRWLRLLDGLDSPYMLVNVPGSLDVALNILYQGYKGEFSEGVRWQAADVTVRDGEGATFVCFREGDPLAPKTPDELAAQLDREWVVKSENDVYKRQKYVKREFAPHQAAVEGRIIQLIGEDGFLVALDSGQEIRVRVPKISKAVFPYVDGMGFVSQRLTGIVLGEELPAGAGVRITCDMMKLFKGNDLVYLGLAWDLVLFAGKKQLRTVGSRFRFAIMQVLHAPQVVFSDPQWVANFNQAALLPEYAEIALNEFLGAMCDESKMLSWITAMLPYVEDTLDSTNDLNEVEDMWSLIRWVRNGRPVTTVPCMRRRLERFFWNRVVNMRNLRVPLPYTQNRYLMPDFTAFDCNGDFHPENAVLVGNEITIPGMRESNVRNLGPVVMNRQPSAHWAEAIDAVSVLHEAYAPMSHTQCPFVFLSVVNLPARMETMGTADWDDPAQIHHDPRVVESVTALIAQGFPGKLLHDDEEDAVVEAPRGPSLLEKRRAARVLQTNWKRQGHRMMVSQLGSSGMGLGPVSNAMMIANHNYLNGIDEKLQIADQTANQSHFIDSLKHVAGVSGFSRTEFEAAITDFWANLTQCSAALLDRVPRRTMINGKVEEVRSHVTPVETDLDRALVQIEKSIETYKQLLAEEAMDALAYPAWLTYVHSSQDVRVLASATVQVFRDKMKSGIEKQTAAFNAAAVDDGSMERTEGNPKMRAALEAKLEGKIMAQAFADAQRAAYGELVDHDLAVPAIAEIMRRRYVFGDKMNASRISDSILGGNDMVKLFDRTWQALLDAEAGLDVSATGLRFLNAPTPDDPQGGELPAPAGKEADVEMMKMDDLEVESIGSEANPFIIVNGLSKKYASPDDDMVVSWRQMAGDVVRLSLVEWFNQKTGVTEDAVRVDLLVYNPEGVDDQQLYGWLKKTQIAAFVDYFGRNVTVEAVLQEPAIPGFSMLADQGMVVPAEQLAAEEEALIAS